MRKTWHLVVAIGCLLFGGASYNVNKQSGIIGIVLGVLIGIFYFFPKIGAKEPAKKPGQTDELQVQDDGEPEPDEDGDDTPEE